MLHITWNLCLVIYCMIKNKTVHLENWIEHLKINISELVMKYLKYMLIVLKILSIFLQLIGIKSIWIQIMITTNFAIVYTIKFLWKCMFISSSINTYACSYRCYARHPSAVATRKILKIRYLFILFCMFLTLQWNHPGDFFSV